VVWACGDRQLPYNNGYKGQTRIAKEVFNHRQNYETINYELCVNNDWQQTCKNAVQIIARDMVNYNIPMTMLFRHYDITGKVCPKPFVDNPDAWEDFKKQIENRVKEIKKEQVINEVVAMFKDENMKASWAKDSVKKIN
jgi:N-acetylmuramoyl-L-alanine amidase